MTDPVDVRLLAALAELGKAAVHELAAKVGMDPREVAYRLVALSGSGLPLLVGVESDPSGLRAAISAAPPSWAQAGAQQPSSGPVPAQPPSGAMAFPQQYPSPQQPSLQQIQPHQSQPLAPQQFLSQQQSPSGQGVQQQPGQAPQHQQQQPGQTPQQPQTGQASQHQPGQTPQQSQTGQAPQHQPGQAPLQPMSQHQQHQHQHQHQQPQQHQPQSGAMSQQPSNGFAGGGPVMAPFAQGQAVHGGPSGAHAVQGTPSGPYPGAPQPQPGATSGPYAGVPGSGSGPYAVQGHQPGAPSHPLVSTWGVPQTASWARGDEPRRAGPPGGKRGRIGEVLATEGLEGEQLTVQLLEVQDPADYLFGAAGYRLEEGERSVVVHTEITNRGSVGFASLPDNYLELVTEDGSTVGKAPVSLTSRPPHKIGVRPGETLGGHTVYILPDATRVVSVRWSPRPEPDDRTLTWAVEL